MALRFQHRPYSGRTPRPTPEVHIEPSINSLVIATPWGPRSAARKAIDRVLEYLLFASHDREATSPFPKLSCLSASANNLRIAAMLANDTLYREDNRDEYKVGVELLVLSATENALSWAQVGGPSLILARSQGLLPVSAQIDLSLDYTASEDHEMPPLPAQLLGLDSSVNVVVNSFRRHPSDKVILLSHSHPPAPMWALSHSEVNLDSVVQLLARTSPDRPFWIGCLEVDESPSPAEDGL